MLTKDCVLLFFTILILNCMTSECRQIQCYSCSDCANSTLLQKDFVITSSDGDQCMKTTVSTGAFMNGQKLVSRGASSNCEPYSNQYFTILCCREDFCNA